MRVSPVIAGLVLPEAERTALTCTTSSPCGSPAKRRVSRDVLVDELDVARHRVRRVLPGPVWDYDCYRALPGVVADPVPNVFAAAAEAVSLPVHQYLSEADLDEIVAAVRKVLG